MKSLDETQTPPLETLSARAVDAFEQGSTAKKVALIAAGLVVVGTAPYWLPPVWRSKTIRGLAAWGANQALTAWLA
jgi:hypothetical protein